VLAGDHIYRMDLAELIDSHIERDAAITIAAQPVSPDGATEMGIFSFDTSGQITGFEHKPPAARLAEMRSSAPPNSPAGLLTPDKPFLASMGIYVFSRDVLYEVLERSRAVDFGREVIPSCIGTHRVHAYVYRGYWADVGNVASFYDANLLLTKRVPPFDFFHPRRPIYTRSRFLPAARLHNCQLDEALVAEGAYLDSCTVTNSVVGVRTAIHRGATVTRSVLLGADYYEDQFSDLPLGVGRDAALDRVIVDKNARIGEGARLVNERNIQDVDGDGYYIRSGIIVVPKNGVVKPGTVV
jgi:glucose-1-phosphate adenylyltransferase